MADTKMTKSLVIGGLYQAGRITYIVLEKIYDSNDNYTKLRVYSFWSKKTELWWQRSCESDLRLA